MANIMEIMQLCRLCLVKDQVNIPIFEEQGDIRQIFLKISACLPVKVSREDNLPKKICDGCSYKLEMLYQFWNTSANSEKQLLKWLSQVGIDEVPTSDKTATTQPHSHSISTDGVILKQEVLDLGETHADEEIPTDDLNVPTDPDYLLQQQSYQSFDEFQQDGFNEGEAATSSTAGPSSTVTSETVAQAPKRKRRAAAMKPLPPQIDSEDEDDDGLVETKIAKTEEQSDDSTGEDPEPTTFVGLPSDNEQPGPSGVGKATASSEAPASSLKVKVETLLNYDQLLHAAGSKAKKRKSNDSDDDDYDEKRTRQKRIWACKKCPERFNTSRKLREHRKVHRKEDNDTQYNYKYDEEKKIFICYTCDGEFNTKEEIEKHVLEHEEKFVCNTCNEPFVKPYEYSCHLYSHDQDKGFQCPFCKYVTSRRTAIMIHINTYHLRKFIYTCGLCGKGFNDCVLYKEHGNIHKGVRPFKCIVCNKDFPFSSYLTTHQIRNHRVTIDGVIGANQCPVCFKSFSRSNTLENHMKRHETMNEKKVHEKKHLCDICGKGFARTEKLRIHYRVHTGVKPYTCSYCAKSFTKKDYLIMHERVHSGEKPYSCEFCGKCFNQGAPLRLHIRSHTGERPYICHLCNVGFISRGVLNLHFRNCPGSSA